MLPFLICLFYSTSILAQLPNELSLANNDTYYDCQLIHTNIHRYYSCNDGETMALLFNRRHDWYFIIDGIPPISRKIEKITLHESGEYTYEQEEADTTLENDLIISYQESVATKKLLKKIEKDIQSSKIFNQLRTNNELNFTNIKQQISSSSSFKLQWKNLFYTCVRENSLCPYLKCSQNLFLYFNYQDTLLKLYFVKNNNIEQLDQFTVASDKGELIYSDHPTPNPTELSMIPLAKTNLLNEFNFPHQIELMKEDINLCSSESAKIPDLLEKTYQAFLKQFDTKNLVSLIIIEEEHFVRKIINKNNLPASSCQLSGDLYFFDSNQYQPDVEDEFSPPTKNPSILTLTQAEKIFNKIKKMKDISFQYQQDGCFARAHIMADRLKNNFQVESRKIWATGVLSPANNPQVQWCYHVAPIIQVRNSNGGIVEMVIDPSISSTLLTKEDWLKKINASSAINVGFPPLYNVKNFFPTYAISPKVFFTFMQKAADLDQAQIDQDMQEAIDRNNSFLK